MNGVPYPPPQPPSLPSTLELAGAIAREGFDPELANLPRSRHKERSLTLLVLMLGILAAFGMVFVLARDAAYAFSGGRTESLGDLRTASPAALAAHENRRVTGEGLLGAVGALRYARPLREDTFRALPVLGRLDLWVEVRVAAGQESGRWEPPRSFAGRLERLDAVGPRHRGLREAIEQATRAPLPGDTWLLVDGVEPAQARWALLLVAVFLASATWNTVAIARIVRKVSA